jgi:nitrite reductase (NADH) small subunit
MDTAPGQWFDVERAEGVRVDVGGENEFEEGAVRLVEVGRRSIGIVRWRGAVHALRNLCPHQGGPACRGLLRPLLKPDSAIGGIALDEERLVLSCPWHGWEFDVVTGHSLWDDTCKLGKYRVAVESGRVLIEIGGGHGLPSREVRI